MRPRALRDLRIFQALWISKPTKTPKQNLQKHNVFCIRPVKTDLENSPVPLAKRTFPQKRMQPVRENVGNFKTAPTVCENHCALETKSNKNTQNTVKPAKPTLVGYTQVFKTYKNT